MNWYNRRPLSELASLYFVHSVGSSVLAKSGEIPTLRWQRSLSADFMFDAVLAAKLDHCVVAFHGEPRFQTSGLVINT